MILENLSQEEIGEPILDRVLQPGDCLYFPRGVIHQASTPTTSHSLHLTLSVYQKSCWSDFMEKVGFSFFFYIRWLDISIFMLFVGIICFLAVYQKCIK